MEYWKGVQTALENSSETPGAPVHLPGGGHVPNYIRAFDAGFLLFLQHIASRKHQVGVKLDWYDPHTGVSGLQIGAIGSILNGADVCYTTLGMGYIFNVNENFKFILWYDRIWNESTSLTGLKEDISDNILTARVQYRF
jgi:hypothetical protein